MGEFIVAASLRFLRMYIYRLTQVYVLQLLMCGNVTSKLCFT